MSPSKLPVGPVHVAVSGLALEAADRERLRHPQVGGVILFASNFHDRTQLFELCRDIHAVREPHLIISVDHEGGRVQRFREGFTRLPPMQRIGELWERSTQQGNRAAWACGLVIATELRACGVDLALTPVLDIDHGASTIIGDRSFHRRGEVVAELAGSLLDGLEDGGMAGVGKHFPGHGFIAADSHLELPVDARSLAEIEACDLIPFRRLANRLGGMMPAHVVYPKVDGRPAGFSPTWVRDILRGQLGFTGAVFSDDLGMEGAAGEGTMDERAHAALQAGCDLVLVCTPHGADELLTKFRRPIANAPVGQLSRLGIAHPNHPKTLQAPERGHPLYLHARQIVAQISQ
jgi:beta-N-acetylhexosaminidase